MFSDGLPFAKCFSLMQMAILFLLKYQLLFVSLIIKTIFGQKYCMYTLVESIAALTQNIFSVEENVKTDYSFSDLSITLMNYLETIAKLDNPSVSELAVALHLTKSTVSINLDKLIEKEYIKKIQSDKDKRVMFLHLTPKGEQVNQLHDEVHKQIAFSFSEKLSSAELEILRILFDKLTR